MKSLHFIVLPSHFFSTYSRHDFRIFSCRKKSSLFPAVIIPCSVLRAIAPQLFSDVRYSLNMWPSRFPSTLKTRDKRSVTIASNTITISVLWLQNLRHSNLFLDRQSRMILCKIHTYIHTYIHTSTRPVHNSHFTCSTLRFSHRPPDLNL